MEGGEDNATNGKKPRKEEETTASRTREESLEDALNTAMEEDGAAADNGEYFDDTGFDAQLDNLDWESGEDPFDAREWHMIRNNLEP
ncbi:MAG: hypothetical protein ACLPH3_12470 [Terracidiphilus sp.]